MKQAREGRRMPGVKKLHQESENSKDEYIFGHLSDAIGILAETLQKWFCPPLFMNLQDGVKTILGRGKQPEEFQASYVVRMIDQGFTAATAFGNALPLLDCHFLSSPALERLNLWNRPEEAQTHLVVKAKANAVAYERPAARTKGRGRPQKRGQAVKLRELFQMRADEFQTTTVTMYGKEETAPFLRMDLLWGQGLYQELRFVPVRYHGQASILDLSCAAALQQDRCD